MLCCEHGELSFIVDMEKFVSKYDDGTKSGPLQRALDANLKIKGKLSIHLIKVSEQTISDWFQLKTNLK